MSTLSLCVPFYENHGMLGHQYETWASYPDALKAQLEVVLVDDGSPTPAADVPRPDGLPPLRLYRVLKDIPWHQHGARNLAATEAAGPWLLLTDMDHVVPADSMMALLDVLTEAPTDAIFTFARVDAPDFTPTLNRYGGLKPHVNSFALTKALFWAVGGYDEDCVGYGTDSYFRRRLFAQGTPAHLNDVRLIRYPREVIADASTWAPGVDPRALRNAGRRREETKRRLERKARHGEGPRVLDFAWERVL